ncbi:hypothetical protein B0H13DRAFT_2364294 [Mycena leptocephala]|nr:hypothetical protein B0H13DRAFT_2364294 [Mycena leptocephala]
MTHPLPLKEDLCFKWAALILTPNPIMANFATTTTTPTSRSVDPDLEALVALVSRLSVAASDATRLATEVQAPSRVGQACGDVDHLDPQRPRTPTAIEAAYPEGSGEVWYVVIRGREPGLYRTADAANAETDGLPHQFREKKMSRQRHSCSTASTTTRPPRTTMPSPPPPPPGIPPRPPST